MKNQVIENKDGSLQCPFVLGTILVRREVKQQFPIEGACFADCGHCRGLSEQNEVTCESTPDGYCALTGKGVVIVDGIKN
jgi:hypothetical protein